MVLLSASKFKQYDIHKKLSQEINRLTTQAFLHEIISPTVENAFSDNAFISYLQLDNKVVATGFGKEDTYDPHSKYKTQ